MQGVALSNEEETIQDSMAQIPNKGMLSNSTIYVTHHDMLYATILCSALCFILCTTLCSTLCSMLSSILRSALLPLLCSTLLNSMLSKDWCLRHGSRIRPDLRWCNHCSCATTKVLCLQNQLCDCYQTWNQRLLHHGKKSRILKIAKRCLFPQS